MEIVPSNSENADHRRRVNRRKRKYISLNESKLSSSSNKAISLMNSKSSSSKAASRGYLLEAPPRAIGDDGHFYECVKCNEVGSLICCDTCACTYHYACLDPPLESVPDGDWFCQNCTEDDADLSDSTENFITSAGSSKRRRRNSLKRACKVSSGCCLCSKIKKKLIPDENDFFSFKTKSTAQPNLSDRGKPSARNDDGVGRRAIIPQNTNNGDKHLVLRPRKRAEEYQIETRQTGKRASSTQAEKDQNTTTVNLRPRRRGRPTVKRTGKAPSTVAPQQIEQEEPIQNPGLAMVLYGENLRPEDIAAITAAEEAQRNKVKEIPWSGVELDALWVGVRRHGPDNWDTILEDPNLRILVLCKKTSPDLSTRWQKELEKMYSIVQISGFLPPLPSDNEPVDQIPSEPVVEEISNGEATSQQLLPLVQIPVTSTESGPLVHDHQGSNGEEREEPKEFTNQAQLLAPESGPLVHVHQGSNGEESGEPKESTNQQLLAPESGPLVHDHQGSSGEERGEPKESTNQQLLVPESGPLVHDHQGSSGEERGEPKESTNQQLLAPESGPLVPNHHQGTSSSSSSSSSSPLRNSPSVPRASDIAVVPNGEAGGERTEANTRQLIAVTSPELSGALVVHNNKKGSSSSSSLGASVSIPRACVTVTAAPPQWRPNLNLHPMANHILSQAFQQRANPETQMMDHMGRVVSFPTTPAGPGRSVAMVAPRLPANSTVRPNLYLGGFIPVRHAHGRPSHPVRNRN